MNLVITNKSLTKVLVMLLATAMLYTVQNYIKFGNNFGYDLTRSFSFNLILIGGFVFTLPIVRVIIQFVSNFSKGVKLSVHISLVIGLVLLYTILSSLSLYGLGYLSKPFHMNFFEKYFSNVVIVHLLSYMLIVKMLNSDISKKETLIEALSGKKKVTIKSGDILFIQSLDHYVKIKTSDQTYLKKISTSDILKSLDRKSFIRIHRSYIINKSKVSKVICDSGKYDVEIDKYQLRVGKTYVAKLKKDPSFTYL